LIRAETLSRCWTLTAKKGGKGPGDESISERARDSKGGTGDREPAMLGEQQRVGVTHQEAREVAREAKPDCCNGNQPRKSKTGTQSKESEQGGSG